MISEERLVELIAGACFEEKALDVVVLEVRDFTVLADYFVIAGARNTIQVRSIADAVEKTLEEHDVLPARQEGYKEGLWIVFDYGAAILHILREEEREYYNLENLWGDAKKVLIPASK